MNSVQVKFILEVAAAREMLTALLANENYSGFEEDEKTFSAFIAENSFDEKILTKIISENEFLKNISFSIEKIEEQNWNAEWEKNFKPVIIDDKIAVRASFHEPINVEHEIIIDPKMSFGTGHHETTEMMMRLMLENNFTNKSILDFGCGTGILSILAFKQGAQKIFSVDNEEWAVNNTKENFILNSVVGQETNNGVELGTKENFASQTFEIVLANINKNVLLDSMKELSAATIKGGKLLMSGFFADDIVELESSAIAYNFLFEKKIEKGKWSALVFVKK